MSDKTPVPVPSTKVVPKDKDAPSVAEKIQEDLKKVSHDSTITKPFYPLGEGSEQE